MAIKQTIEADLKTALLGGEKDKATVLRGLKSTILNAEIASGAREQGLDDAAIIPLLKKEVKSRTESAELYQKANETERANKELSEKTIIEAYLPEQMSDEDIIKIVDEVVAGMGEVSMQQMGQVIGQVKQKAGPAADGARIAILVKEKLA